MVALSWGRTDHEIAPPGGRGDLVKDPSAATLLAVHVRRRGAGRHALLDRSSSSAAIHQRVAAARDVMRGGMRSRGGVGLA